MIVMMARSTKNNSEKLRVSCDTRWQKAEQPIDPRSLNDNALMMMIMRITLIVDDDGHW